jgi:hypothetical protein
MCSSGGLTNLAAGLCATCKHAKRMESDRGSTFLLCQLALSDARFPKYPRLPVKSCSGYSRSAGVPPEDPADKTLN